MHSLEHVARSASRRAVLRGGLAGVLVLGFRLSAHAANEPVQPPDAFVIDSPTFTPQHHMDPLIAKTWPC